MILVQFLADRNVLCVSGIATPFPAGSLQARRQGDMLALASPHEEFLLTQWTRFDGWLHPDGSAFASPEEGFAYLTDACTRKRPLAVAVPQDAPASTWTVHHTLGFVPNVTLVDTAGDVFEGDIRHLDQSTILITLSAPTAGVAYLS